MSRSLLLRILSAAILVPVAIGGAWAGGPWFSAVVGVFALGMAWEWGGICGRGGRHRIQSLAIIATIAAATALGAAGWWLAAVAVAVAGSAIVVPATPARAGRIAWLAPAGTLYIALAVLAVLAIRAVGGLAPMLWLFVVVWATDIFAYAVGRSVGGPLLAPALSPRKTWSGLIGGAAAAAISGAVVGHLTGGPSVAAAAGLAVLLAVVAQAGDLAESAVKRYAGVKDASGLIPGHGGMLDRLDGLMAAALVFVLLKVVFGEGLTAWR
jgi:phosphatidate cytidylyltransferase